jgi:hypothetical protein
MSNDDFWTSLTGNSSSQLLTAAMDTHLSGKSIGESFEGVRALTDMGRAKKALALPVEAGTRVAFVSNVGAVLTYENPPTPGSMGTVVTVKSAGSNITAHEGKVFVSWDDGSFLPVHSEHLVLATKEARVKRQASSVRLASLGDLTSFFTKVGNDTLIHKSTRDLWALKQDTNGFLIERLFDDHGEPLKA